MVGNSLNPFVMFIFPLLTAIQQDSPPGTINCIVNLFPGINSDDLLSRSGISDKRLNTVPP